MKKFIALAALAFSLSANAAWLNSTAEVEDLVTYPGNTILFKLKNNNGTNISACSNKEYFAISSTYPEEARARLYSTLLAATISKTPVTISYSDTGNCEAWGNSPSVYRRVTRLTL
ncbi:hypothetical protein [Pseudoalteromonas piscicida]|uniref:Uncharacterized protein n=1 Tax=Pseudoalteromonas piscicida TaxID=43662 RepID=A0A2A5JWA9_PSEO7|nr:hypothetical protein [Pseudoalteromonas piscicida]PCK33745.1 hypothetical protein CEX98_00240 [Pseudoalteromonas piscicida]